MAQHPGFREQRVHLLPTNFFVSKAGLRVRYLRFGIGFVHGDGLLHLRQNFQHGLKPLWVLDDYCHSAMAFRSRFREVIAALSQKYQRQ